MPASHPEEFRRRAVELARLREKPIAAIAKCRHTKSSSCPDASNLLPSASLRMT